MRHGACRISMRGQASEGLLECQSGVDKGTRSANFCALNLRFMPNTKSAERRMRNSARKQLRNRSVKSRLKTFEKRYVAALDTGKKDESTTALREAISTFDKAVKAGVIHRATANRKKSRLTLRLAKLK